MNDLETQDAAAFLERYPHASNETLEAHLAECRVRRYQALIASLTARTERFYRRPVLALGEGWCGADTIT